jgi:hypothetical protein
MQSWCIPVVSRIVTALPTAEIVVMSSSFPDSFSHIVGNNEEPAHETHVFNVARQQFQNANLTLGDWGSTRLSQNGGGGKIPSRIDVSLPSSWHIFRADPDADLGFAAVASQVIDHNSFVSVPSCWGKLQIEETDGLGTGITGTKMNTSARINMHMTIKAGANSTLDLNEVPYED